MAELLTDSQGRPIPQFLGASNTYEAARGQNGAMNAVVTNLPVSTFPSAAPAVNVKVVNDAGVNAVFTPDGLAVDVNRVHTKLSSVVACSSPVVVAGLDCAITTFAVVTNVLYTAVQIYATADVDILSIQVVTPVAFSIGTKNVPLVTQASDIVYTSKTVLSLLVAPEVNAVLPQYWQVIVVTAAAAAPAVNVMYQYVA